MAEKKIGDRVYSVDPLLATKAVRLLARLTKVAGAAVERLPVIFSGIGTTGEAAEKSNSAAVAAFSDIFMKNDTDEIVTLVTDIVQVAKIKRQSGAWDHVDFDGDMTDAMEQIIPVALFVLQEQFAGFFGGALAGGSLKFGQTLQH